MKVWRGWLPVLGVLSVIVPAQMALGGERIRQVVVIVVDTLRADRLGLHGYDARPTSPELDAWSKRARVYERAFTTSPWTLPAMASLYTGTLPRTHRAGLIDVTRDAADVDLRPGQDGKGIGRLSPRVAPLAQVLSASGYATAAIVNNSFLSAEFGVDRGFESYDYDGRANMAIRRADVVVDRALERLDAAGDRPLFLLVHFIDPHMEYNPPDAVRGRFTAGLGSRLKLPVRGVRAIREGKTVRSEVDRAFVSAAYDEELAGLDIQVGRLLRALDARGILSDGLVVFTSDHGEELFEHGGFEHGHALWQELLHVPLLVWGRGVRAGRESAPVSLVDVAPTVWQATSTSNSAAVGREAPIEGVSLWSNLRRAAPLPERDLYAEATLFGAQRTAVIRWPDKLCYRSDDGAPLGLFELVGDPHERANRLEAQGSLVDELGQRARAHLAALEADAAIVGGSVGDPSALSPELKEQLRALGYLD